MPEIPKELTAGIKGRVPLVMCSIFVCALSTFIAWDILSAIPQENSRWIVAAILGFIVSLLFFFIVNVFVGRIKLKRLYPKLKDEHKSAFLEIASDNLPVPYDPDKHGTLLAAGFLVHTKDPTHELKGYVELSSPAKKLRKKESAHESQDEEYEYDEIIPSAKAELLTEVAQAATEQHFIHEFERIKINYDRLEIGDLRNGMKPLRGKAAIDRILENTAPFDNYWHSHLIENIDSVAGDLGTLIEQLRADNTLRDEFREELFRRIDNLSMKPFLEFILAELRNDWNAAPKIKNLLIPFEESELPDLGKALANLEKSLRPPPVELLPGLIEAVEGLANNITKWPSTTGIRDDNIAETSSEKLVCEAKLQGLSPEGVGSNRPWELILTSHQIETEYIRAIYLISDKEDEILWRFDGQFHRTDHWRENKNEELHIPLLPDIPRKLHLLTFRSVENESNVSLYARVIFEKGKDVKSEPAIFISDAQNPAKVSASLSPSDIAGKVLGSMVSPLTPAIRALMDLEEATKKRGVFSSAYEEYQNLREEERKTNTLSVVKRKRLEELHKFFGERSNP
jgi:hypothetical protein